MSMFSSNARRSPGFTLVELLIVISIIGILIALVMPAVQSAQESARRAQCSNNLHQMALGCLALESKYGFLPGGGWSWTWAGDPNRGFGASQPGGWHYQILPFIDQGDLFDMGKGQPDATRRQSGQAQARVPVAVFLCPTRHHLQVFPRANRNDYININDPYPIIAHSDYAACEGTNYADVNGPNNAGYQPNTGYSPTFDWTGVNGTMTGVAAATGVIFRASALPTSLIKDGVSNTYMIGERYLCPDCYYTDSCCDNDQGWDEGYDWDTIRCSGNGYVNSQYPSLPPSQSPSTPGLWVPPSQDRPGIQGCMSNFGSAHEAGFNMAFCDGTVRLMNFDIRPDVHMELGHRSDGEPTDLSQLNGNK